MQELWLGDNHVSDLEGIQELLQLDLLDLNRNKISDITLIAQLANLRQLNLQNNELQFVLPLLDNLALQSLDLRSNDSIICSEQDQLELLFGNKLNKSFMCQHWNLVKKAVFADKSLEACVMQAVTDLDAVYLEQIKQLDCSDKNIKDIEGIQYLAGLDILSLSNNQIRDITSVGLLGSLRQLNLQGNNLQLLSPLNEIQLLEQVDISDNSAIICSEQTQLEAKLGDKLITSSACIEWVQQAQDATFEDTNLQACIRETAQDIGVEHLEQIQQLKCVNQAINNIDGIEQLTNLRELDLTQNNISDITPLQNLALLKKVLLSKNQISNIQPLITSQYMQKLRVDYNQLTNIQGIQALKVLRQIYLSNSSIIDITPIQTLARLIELRISNNRLIDIDPVAGLNKLTSLWLQDNQIVNLKPLQQLQNLEQLWLSNNWLTDLTPLQNQSKLKWLHLDGTEITDLQPLNKLTQLKWLQLDDTRVDDISAIYPLAQLDWLHLKGNNTIPCSQLYYMEEIIGAEKIDKPQSCNQSQERIGTPISTIDFKDKVLRDCVYDAAKEQGITDIEELTTLSCIGTDITDISELLQLSEIISLDLSGNNHIPCAQLDELMYNFTSVEITLPEQCGQPIIEFQTSQYSGTYSWDCGSGLSGSENITLDLSEAGGVIAGTADYLGGQIAITNGFYDEFTGEISFDLPVSTTNVSNLFTGFYTPDDPAVKISGTTTRGDSPAGEGCESEFGAVGAMYLF